MATAEFSRPVRLDMLGAGVREEAIEATPDERAALAQRFDILSIESLRAEVSLMRSGEVVTCTGRLWAALAQACVASGDPVEALLDEPFALRFVPEQAIVTDEEVELDAADLDEIGYAGGSVDIGEAVAQTLALALDPFPRSPHADEALSAAGVVGEEEAGPFGALKVLKDRLQ